MLSLGAVLVTGDVKQEKPGCKSSSQERGKAMTVICFILSAISDHAVTLVSKISKIWQECKEKRAVYTSLIQQRIVTVRRMGTMWRYYLPA